MAVHPSDLCLNFGAAGRNYRCARTTRDAVIERKHFPKLALVFLKMWSAVVGIWLTQILMLVAGQSLTDIKQTFHDAGVVPDVLPAFHPSALLQVTFPNITIVPGQNLTKEGISRIPAFIVSI